MVKVEISTEILPLHIVGCLIRYRGKILLLRRQEGKRHARYWGAAAGKISDNDENPKNAMIRELFEETGIVASEHELELKHIFNVDQGDQKFTYNYFSLNLENEPIIKLSPTEHSEYRFFDMKEIVRLFMVPGELECMTYTLDHEPK